MVTFFDRREYEPFMLSDDTHHSFKWEGELRISHWVFKDGPIVRPKAGIVNGKITKVLIGKDSRERLGRGVPSV